MSEKKGDVETKRKFENVYTKENSSHEKVLANKRTKIGQTMGGAVVKNINETTKH